MSAMIFRAIDFETTGAPSDAEDAPPVGVCEVGFCDLSLAEAFGEAEFSGPVRSRLCDPGMPMQFEACAVHHIVADDIKDCAPFDPAELRDGAPDFFVAHNADFEQHFFDGGETPWIDTYKVALRVWPDAPSHGLQFLRYWLDLPADRALASPPHRAGPDAYLCALLMQRILTDSRMPIDDMVRFSAGIALLPRINFGKHRGAKWSEVPADYLDWIINGQNDLDRTVKANARYWLKQRVAE